MDAIAQLQQTVLLWLSICGVVAATAGFVAAVSKFWAWMHKDSSAATEHLVNVDTFLASDKRRIENLESQQAIMEEQQKLQLKALMTLLSAQIDGNHKDQLISTRNEINEYLIDKSTNNH